jgi:hypothetical protein
MGFSVVISSGFVAVAMLVALATLSSVVSQLLYETAVSAIEAAERPYHGAVVSIVYANVTCTGDVFYIHLENRGPGILWDFNASEIIVSYRDNSTGNNVTAILYHPDNWSIVALLAGDALLPPHPSVYPGETAIIRGSLSPPADVQAPVIFSFVDSGGGKAYYRVWGC